MSNKTHYTKPGEVQSDWFVVDATNKVLGRLASEVAKILRGKHKPTFSPSVDAGDHVIVLNADKVAVTGNKGSDKLYRHYSGYPGGLKETSFNLLMKKHPERIIEKAVWGMLPKNRLGRAQIKKLRVYTGDTHQHEAQKPQPLEF
jgi:large subunit ribosomal protein L13